MRSLSAERATEEQAERLQRAIEVISAAQLEHVGKSSH
jgi:hypothetical protein